MKISTYHKMLGDKVTFFKGDPKELVINEIYGKCLASLKRIDRSIEWESKSEVIKRYLRAKRAQRLQEIGFTSSPHAASIERCLNRYAESYRNKEYEKNPSLDRIYVTTLFTFYWDITIETIEFAKKLVKKPDQLLIGGVMASLLSKEIEEATGIKPYSGLLDQPGMLDKTKKAEKIIVDDLPLDYSILDEIEYKYPTASAYFTFMTKGCTRKCAFCSVPKLEPTYKPKIETISKFGKIAKDFGEQRNLLLMDNNVLASPQFPEIIQEIKDMGFVKGAKYVEPNQLVIAIRNLKEAKHNDRAYIMRSFRLIQELRPRLKGDSKVEYDAILEKYHLQRIETVTKTNLIRASKHLAPIYEKRRLKTSRLRYVDFNQGTDARYVTDELMKLMSEIPIRPLRIAFDYIGLKNKYIAAVELAAKHGIKELSNYILYNFVDTPEELYLRLQINVELSERLGVYIHSFPMKYIPLFGEEAKGRDYVGKHWNRKFIRSIQSILNVTRGIVPPGRTLFERAFGKTLEEFQELLYMPEQYLIFRALFEDKLGYTAKWQQEYRSLTPEERLEANAIVSSNNFKGVDSISASPRVKTLLRHYTIPRGTIDSSNAEYRKLKRKYDKIIHANPHHNLTLTYDFETRRPAPAPKRVKAVIPLMPITSFSLPVISYENAPYPT